jgi:foldase protein PrsA
MRTAVASVAAIATAVGVGACTGGAPGSGPGLPIGGISTTTAATVPSNAIAVVGSFAISQKSFAHWLVIASRLPYVNSGTTPPAVPDPPSYKACIAATRAEYAKGAKIPSAIALGAQCASRYSQLSQEVITLLAQDAWVQGEAYDEHARVTPAQVDAAWTSQSKTQFPTKAKLDNYLAESGFTVADIKWYLLFSLLQQAITTKANAGVSKVSQAAIASYYHAHLTQYTQPERRNLDLVLVASAATAAKVKSLLAGGAAFATVAKKYSIDPTTKNTGGVANGIQPGEETARLNAAIFAAPVGALEGPLKTAFGYYVFKVTASTPKSTETLHAASSAIKAQIVSKREQAATNRLRVAFTTSWKSRTTCAAQYMDSTVCGNAPASSGATGTTGTS